MKKILIISAVFPPEPLTSARMNYDLAKTLAEEYDVTVVRPAPSRPIGYHYDRYNKEEVIDGFSLVTLNSFLSPESKITGRIKESLSFSRACIKYMKREKGTFSFVYNDAWQFFGLYLIAKYCKKNHIPYILPIQDVYPESLLTHLKFGRFITGLVQFALRPIDKYYQKNASYIRTITDEMASYLSMTRNIPRDKYCIVYNWQDIPHCSYAEPSNDKRVFAYFGSINEHANVELIIKAFIASNINNSQLWIYGSGNRLQNCQKLVVQSRVSNIIFGKFTPNDMYELQSKADVLVLALPSGNGNLALPSKLSSYLFSGKPVLASVDSGCTVDRLLKNNNCGITVQPDDIVSFSKGFSLLSNMTDSEIRIMGDKGRDFALNYLTKESNLAKVIDIIGKSIKEDKYGSARIANKRHTK